LKVLLRTEGKSESGSTSVICKFCAEVEVYIIFDDKGMYRHTFNKNYLTKKDIFRII